MKMGKRSDITPLPLSRTRSSSPFPALRFGSGRAIRRMRSCCTPKIRSANTRSRAPLLTRAFPIPPSPLPEPQSKILRHYGMGESRYEGSGRKMRWRLLQKTSGCSECFKAAANVPFSLRSDCGDERIMSIG